MMDQNTAPEGSEEDKEGEQGGKRHHRDYASYIKVDKLSFDPMKDLNLPSSYEEVIARFKRLQTMHAMESLN